MRKEFWAFTPIDLDTLKQYPDQVVKDLTLAIPRGAVQGSQRDVRWIIRTTGAIDEYGYLKICQNGTVKVGTMRG